MNRPDTTLYASPMSRPVPPGRPTSTAAVAATSPGKRPARTAASSTRSRTAANPSGVLPYSLHQTFHASTWGSPMRIMRGLVEPSIKRWTARPRRPRVDHAVLDPVVGAVKVDPPIPQQAANDGERLFEAGHTMVIREPERAVLPFVPARAEAEDQPPARNGVDGRRLLGKHRRRMKARRRDEWSKLDAVGGGGQRGKRGPRLPRSPRDAAGQVIEQVVTKPQRVEPDASPRRGPSRTIPATPRAVRPRAVGYQRGRDEAFANSIERVRCPVR